MAGHPLLQVRHVHCWGIVRRCIGNVVPIECLSRARCSALSNLAMGWSLGRGFQIDAQRLWLPINLPCLLRCTLMVQGLRGTVWTRPQAFPRRMLPRSLASHVRPVVGPQNGKRSKLPSNFITITLSCHFIFHVTSTTVQGPSAVGMDLCQGHHSRDPSP